MSANLYFILIKFGQFSSEKVIYILYNIQIYDKLTNVDYYFWRNRMKRIWVAFLTIVIYALAQFLPLLAQQLPFFKDLKGMELAKAGIHSGYFICNSSIINNLVK